MPQAGMSLEPQVLEGRFVRLEPFAPSLKEEVRAAVDCDPEAWGLVGANAYGDAFDTWWERHCADLARGAWIPHAVRRLSDGVVVGATSYMTIRKEHRGLEIGSTFLHPGARSGPANPEAKLLMLERAFDRGAVRVEILTDLRNLRSQAAIAKLGAVREGVLRRHKITWTGHIRDTVLFAITDSDWPEVRAALEARLATF